MRVAFEDEAMNQGKHVRVEFNANRTQVQIGTTTANMMGFLADMPVMEVGRDRVKTAEDLATCVDYYAKLYRVGKDVTASNGIMRSYRLDCGKTINGEV